MIKAEIVADSVGPSGVRLTTFVLTYPRFIHAEFMTHRVFSRNASSSRAIPVTKTIQTVIDDPAKPLSFNANQKGMQAGDAIAEQDKALEIWLKARDAAVQYANELNALGVHKQYVNRLLEPFAHITVVVTATDFDNFFALRLHPAADPMICELAKKMWEVYSTNKPYNLKTGEWHLPFITPADVIQSMRYHNSGIVDEIVEATVIKRSVAKCARVSYNNHDGKPTTVEEDLSLYERLLGQLPIHASPAEHQALAIPQADVQSGNLRGWIQYRKMVPNERISTFTGPEDDLSG